MQILSFKAIGAPFMWLGFVPLLTADARAVETVTINAAMRYQTMDGFGTSSRLFDDPHVFDNFNPTTGRPPAVQRP